MDIKDAVKKRMAEKGVKVSDLARMTGYTPRHIYDLLSGGARWNETTISKIFGVLDLQLDVKTVEHRATGTAG